jgi:hypothetical protein
MTRRMVLGLVVVVMLATGGWVLAQQQPGQGGDKGAASSGRFAVAPAGNGAILVDTATGKTWFLHHSVDKSRPSVWLPMDRLEGDEASRWFDMENALRQKAERQLREEGPPAKLKLPPDPPIPPSK